MVCFLYVFTPLNVGGLSTMPFFYDFSQICTWILLALGFSLFELLTPGLFACLAFSFGCLVSAFTSLFSPDTVLQSAIGLGSSVLAFLILRHYLISAKLSPSEIPHISTNTQALIGKEAVLETNIAPHQTGLVRTGGEVWTGKHNHSITLKAGTWAIIIRIQGNTLILKAKELLS